MTIKHHFFGKDCIINRALTERDDLIKNLRAKNFNFSDILFTNQIHSNQVISVGEKNNDADGLITNLKNTVIGVYSADCCPILLFCEEPQIIAAIHAGWKGAKSGIIKSAIEAMNNFGEKLGFKNLKITAIIGPSIRQESYEVGPEFFANFLQEDKNNQRFFNHSTKPNHHMFDLVGYVKNKLQNQGVNDIEDTNIDTYTNPQSFFSYRRSCHLKEVGYGHNISVIMIE
jgi:YfiH family protein